MRNRPPEQLPMQTFAAFNMKVQGIIDRIDINLPQATVEKTLIRGGNEIIINIVFPSTQQAAAYSFRKSDKVEYFFSEDDKSMSYQSSGTEFNADDVEYFSQLIIATEQSKFKIHTLTANYKLLTRKSLEQNFFAALEAAQKAQPQNPEIPKIREQYDRAKAGKSRGIRGGWALKPETEIVHYTNMLNRIATKQT